MTVTPTPFPNLNRSDTPTAEEEVKAVASEWPQPQRRDGKEPCGECHLPAGETCDICGATATPSWQQLWNECDETKMGGGLPVGVLARGQWHPGDDA